MDPGGLVNLGVAVGNLGFSIGRLVDPSEHAALVYRIGESAEQLGFDSVWVGDHLALPRRPSTPYPYGGGSVMVDPDTSMLEPFAVLAALAGRTRRVKLGLGVVVAPYRHPLVSAKLIATIDALSGGRMVVGVGTGWMPEEFAAVGASFAERGRDTDACLAYWREAFVTGEVDGMTILPRPVQRPHPPIWVGGNGAAAMRRAVAFADGWDAPYAEPGQLQAGIALLRERCREMGREPSTLALSVRGIAADTVDAARLDVYAGLGVSEIGVTVPYRDADLAVATLEQLARRCASHLG